MKYKKYIYYAAAFLTAIITLSAVTYKYKNEDIETNWIGGTDAENVSSLYRYIEVTAFLGAVFTICFLKKSRS